jgi:alpha-tubulin suppressor-like RCC1 family protein
MGQNLSGQTNVPTNATNVVSIAAGSRHSLALRRDGTVVLWGNLPPFAPPFATVPADATNVVALALGPGAQHSLFLRSDGTVEDWGNPYYGNSLTNIPPMARNVVAVAAGLTMP